MHRARIVLTLCVVLIGAMALRAEEIPPPPPPAPPPPPPPPPQLVDLSYAPTGLFASAEVDIVRARIRDYGAPLDSIKLDLAAMPRVTVGFGLGGGMALEASYRVLSTDAPSGTFKYLPYYPDFFVNPQLTLQTLEFDLLGRELDHLGLVRTQWHVGVRLAKADIETYSFPYPSLHANDQFSGVGGHFGPQVDLVLGNTGLAFYAMSDFGALWGTNHFNTWAFASGHGPGSSDPQLVSISDSESQGLLTVRAEVGMSWTYCIDRLRLRAAGGYALEYWFFPGLTKGDGSIFNSPGTGIPMEGAFLKFEVQF